jgi:hypothetical protein
MKPFIHCAAFGLVLVFISCEKTADSTSAAAAAGTGVGGSLAKFTIIGNYIYAVSSHYLYTIDISNPASPVRTAQSALSFDMETIYPYKNRLFIGSKTGLYIYSIDTASEPRLIGQAKHGRSCDPVVANDTVSYSTLKGNTYCGPATSGLYVYNIKKLDQPELKKIIQINDPIGLGMTDFALYVCCQNEGLKVFSIKNAYNPVEIQTISNSDFIDVIPYHDVLICWVRKGISLYDISNTLKPIFIKTIEN